MAPNAIDTHHSCMQAMEGHVEIVQLLLESRANVNSKCRIEGTTALAAAARQGHQDFVCLLLQYGASIDVCGDQGTTPLMWAYVKEHGAIVELLLDANADLSIRDKIGRTALDWVKHGDTHQIAQILTAHRESHLKYLEL